MLAMKAYAKAVKNSACGKHYAELDAKLNAKNTGVHTHEIKGRPDYVNRQMNLFYQNLRSEYGNNWRVIDTASHAIPTGVCMYITYEVF